MCYECDKKDIVKNAENLGINVKTALADTGEVWFESEEDRNLYRVLGTVKEGNGIKFLVSKKRTKTWWESLV